MRTAVEVEGKKGVGLAKDEQGGGDEKDEAEQRLHGAQRGAPRGRWQRRRVGRAAREQPGEEGVKVLLNGLGPGGKGYTVIPAMG